MSQNAVLDRETLSTGSPRVAETEATPVARLQREHLTLIDWDPAAGDAAPASAARAAHPVIAARRPWFGWTEACTGLLLLAAGAACLSSLFNL